MEKSTAKAMARQVRISPMKVRQVLALIRGKDAGEALTILRFSPQKAARIVYKVLQSAVANAELNDFITFLNIKFFQFMVKKNFSFPFFQHQ